MNDMWPRVRSFLVWAGCAVVFVTGFVITIVQTDHLARISSDPSSVASADTAIVLGASVLRDGTPSDALRDRLLVGEQLWREKKVTDILITGDDGRYRVDEISVMRRFLEQRGVPAESIRQDGQGYRTYESCKRAATVFGVKKAIVVTQRFHLGRALYLCNKLGIEADGVDADLQPYRRIVFFWLRDLASSAKAWWDINVQPPASPVAAGL